MVWSIDLDDFGGFCSNATFPLSRMISDNLRGKFRERCKSLQGIVDPGSVFDLFGVERRGWALVKWGVSDSRSILVC